MDTMKYTILFASMLLLAAPAVASQHGDTVDANPGMIGPDSMLYGLEIAMDNAGMAIGLKKAGDVAQERAAEARAMQQQNKTDAMMKAARQMNAVAKKASSSDTEGLQKAQSILETVMSRAPSQAQTGLQTALDSIGQAQQRASQEARNPNGTAPADEPGSGDVDDTPGGDQAPDGPVNNSDQRQ